MTRPVFGVDRDPNVVADASRPCARQGCGHTRGAHRGIGCVGTAGIGRFCTCEKYVGPPATLADEAEVRR